MAETQDALSQPERIIRNAVIHLANEQPLLADLIGMPEASQVTLVCTNLRTLGGKRPVFADHSESTFFFPMAHIRFVEVPPAGAGMPGGAGRPAAVEPVAAGVGAGESDLEIDEEFLRRIREA